MEPNAAHNLISAMPLGHFKSSESNNSKDTGRMTPLEDREKRMPPRKRPRQQFECACDHCRNHSSLQFSHRNDVTADDFESDDEDDLLDVEEHAQMTQEVAMLKDAVGKIQSQMSVASEQLIGLRALAQTLVELRASQLQWQELKKRRVEP